MHSDPAKESADHRLALALAMGCVANLVMPQVHTMANRTRIDDKASISECMRMLQRTEVVDVAQLPATLLFLGSFRLGDLAMSVAPCQKTTVLWPDQAARMGCLSSLS